MAVTTIYNHLVHLLVFLYLDNAYHVLIIEQGSIIFVICQMNECDKGWYSAVGKKNLASKSEPQLFLLPDIWPWERFLLSSGLSFSLVSYLYIENHHTYLTEWLYRFKEQNKTPEMRSIIMYIRYYMCVCVFFKLCS